MYIFVNLIKFLFHNKLTNLKHIRFSMLLHSKCFY